MPRLEKWYVDTLLDDGAVLIIYLGILRIAGAQVSRATVEFFPLAGTPIFGRSSSGPVENDAAHVRIGDVRLDANGVRFAAGPLQGSLRFAPRSAGVELVAPMLRDGAHTLTWNIEVPDADVEGTLAVGTVSRNVRGRGYRDRVLTDIAPWRFPVRSLSWGRACAGTHAATWVDMRTLSGERTAAALVDGEIRRGVTDIPPEVVLTDARVLLATRVTAHRAFGLGLLRPVARFLYGDPHEEKRAGRAWIGDASGFALWETVQFGAQS
jgi:hypothetical protein